ncbi:MAG: 16S rRNA (cytidine(1402)-2'-O)-methyltransferase [Chlamydiales bacterium]|nr:16S rRNA (cytidine(1402)-2'-O)-methyltransferase [Chlamydiia bacterium]MCP5508400.1 16S rRNA (cytidine(1402)-2'-O)-methyltransferase [Chlamydiales bacterium]
MLYIVATPIGHLSDITFRAVEILKSCDLILCEDTRHSRILMDKYAISTPLQSYHKFSESEQLERILSDLRTGKQLALISDAGTPCISDPGQKLVNACHLNNIPIATIPGPCAAIAALAASGLPSDRFQFIGFLPKKQTELVNAIAEAMNYRGTSICYESPQRIKNILAYINTVAPDRQLALARELTKKFEECVRGTAIELLEHWNLSAKKGELVLMISPFEESEALIEKLSVADHVIKLCRDYNLSKKESIKLVAEMRNLPKREVYQALLEKESE